MIHNANLSDSVFTVVDITHSATLIFLYVSKVAVSGMDDWVHLPTGGRNFLLASMASLALRPTQPPVQRVPGAVYCGLKQSI
jgi:hypothetical protein